MMNDEASPTPERLGKAALNERRKALATTLNAFSVAGVIAGVVQPMIAGDSDLSVLAGSIVLFVALQIVLHYVLRRLED